MSNEKLLSVMTDIRNWIRAASHGSVKTLLEAALSDTKARSAYQMLDGTTSFEQMRVACKMGKAAVVTLAQQCVAMGLMEITAESRRRRLFDLRDFGLISSADDDQKEGARNGKQNRRGKR